MTDDVAGTDQSAVATREDGSSNGWSEYSRTNPTVERVRGTLAGIGSGLVGGMGAYMFSQNTLAPRVAGVVPPELWGLTIAVLGGAFGHLLVKDTRESVTAMLVGFFVAMATIIVARVAPIYVLFPSPAQGLLVRQQLKFALETSIFVLMPFYWGGYLTTLFVMGYLDR